jgi:hypothetical protein
MKEKKEKIKKKKEVEHQLCFSPIASPDKGNKPLSSLSFQPKKESVSSTLDQPLLSQSVRLSNACFFYLSSIAWQIYILLWNPSVSTLTKI